MDRRTLLPEGTLLQFPGMPCTIESFVGKGSNAVVYLGSYPDQHQPELRHRVLVKELFPYHPQGAVYRDSRNCIRFDEDGVDLMHLHRISFNRGNEIHIRLHSRHPEDMDTNINTFSLHNTLYSVLGFSGGRSFDKELDMMRADKTGLGVHVRRILGTLDVLEAFHEAGYLHLDISPDNILLIGDGKKERISLIDYNSVHTLEEIRNGEEIYFSAKEGYTPPEIRMQRVRSIGFATDIYSLTSVFYRCVTGHKLNPLEMLHQAVPDLSGVQCLEDMPDTVFSMVRHILRRGLASVSRHRYQNAAAMRMDLEELQNRIDGRGITHWALWETGRAGVLHTVKANPALEYIQDDEKIYPVAGTLGDGTTIHLPELYHSLTMDANVFTAASTLEQDAASASGHATASVPEHNTVFKEKSAVLLGSGGMGKTTALLRMAYLQNPRYSIGNPAVIYISLYGWNDSGSSYIKNKILENLRFKPETDSMETAKHELIRLLSSPLHTAGGERPKLLLLLDGFNEASGDLTQLNGEIAELSELSGLRILVTSRSPITGLNFPEITLRQLEDSEVASILSENGIFPPENQESAQLLRTPMMLSIFIKATLDGERHLFELSYQDLHKMAEYLLSSYLTAMLEKEAKNASEDSGFKWRTQAAVYYVLPEMSVHFSSEGTMLSDQELLSTIEKCFRRLSKRDMRTIFPQWIGHMSDIRGNAENAEEWYGMMVHGILWRRLGLIIREENGKYRIVHQMMEEYLAEMGRGFRHRFARRQRIRAGIAALCCLVLTGAAWEGMYLPYKESHMAMDVKEHYDERLAELVLDHAVLNYANSAKQYESVMLILECVQEDTIDEISYTQSLENFQDIISFTSVNHIKQMLGDEENMLAAGEVMPWSETVWKPEKFGDFIALPVERAEEYQKYVGILEQLKRDQKLWETFGHGYVEDFTQAVVCDACVAGKYYELLIEPELNAMENSGLEEVRDHGHYYLNAAAHYTKQNEITENLTQKSLERYERERREAWKVFREHPEIKLVGEG